MTREIFIKKAREIHGYRYDYSLVEFKKINDKIAIICPKHGVFYQQVRKHIYDKQGCPKCAGKTGRKYTTESFIERCKTLPDIENIKFDEVEYAGYKQKVKLYCTQKDNTGNEHGYFYITPNHFFAGERCPKCRYIKSANAKRRSLDDVKAIAAKIHNGKYDYSLITEYKNDRIKYPIICPEHGVFYQTFNNHIKAKQGCPECGRKKSDLKRRMSFEDFKKKANEVHNGKYTYVEESYISASDKLKIICPLHGEFEQDGENHICLRQGCPKCGNFASSGESEIYHYVCSLIGQDKVKERYKGAIDGKFELDVFVPSKNFAIEFDGLFWHSEVMRDRNYHLWKTNECLSKGIRLFHVFEDEWLEKESIIKSMISNFLGFTKRKIYARKCSLRDIGVKEAKQFLNDNHLQGYCVSKYRLGLFNGDELVSVMTFGKSRHFVGNNGDKIELLRFANKIDTIVVGGASKLFTHFIREHDCKEIVSYADKRWSEGHLYETLNFQKYNESRPNYYYVIGRKRVYRFNLRKSVLVKKYNCPVSMSEKEFCLKQKWYRIYDCGCLCYIWKR